MAEAAMSHREVYPPRVAATRACSAHADRFLAAAEAEVPDGYKAAIVAAASQDAVRVAFADAVFPPASGSDPYSTRPRALPHRVRRPLQRRAAGRRAGRQPR